MQHNTVDFMDYIRKPTSLLYSHTLCCLGGRVLYKQGKRGTYHPLNSKGTRGKTVLQSPQFQGYYFKVKGGHHYN